MPQTASGFTVPAGSDAVSTIDDTLVTMAGQINSRLNGLTINAQTGTTYTFLLGDAGQLVTFSNAAAVSVTVPTNASVAYATGTFISLMNRGAGTVTVAGAGGVTVNGASLTLAQNETGTLVFVGSNTWNMSKGGGIPKASYSSTTGSPTITTVSGKTCLVYNASGSITIDRAGLCEVLAVGGGGGGGQRSAGGGGAGGYNYQTSAYLPAGTHTITVGAGGAAGNSNPTPGNSGNASGIGNLVVAAGGGGGGSVQQVGTNGASGGGGGGGGGTSAGGNGYSSQGNNGGTSSPTTTAQGAGGGGGSAGAGSGGSGSAGGNGGAATSNSITGSAVSYAGGGGGGSAGGTAGTGGTNAGNGTNDNTTAGSGTANRGGGGGGGGFASGAGGVGGAGGSGLVILLIG